MGASSWLWKKGRNYTDRRPRAPYYLSALGARLAEQMHGSYPKETPEMSLYTLNMHEVFHNTLSGYIYHAKTC